MDDERVHSLAAHNMRMSGPGPRESSLAVWALVFAAPSIIVINDLRLDGRTAQHPLVAGEPHLRFMMAIPIVLSSGVCIGAL